LQLFPDAGLFFPDVRNLASQLKRRKPVKRFLVSVVLACVLSSSALAGDIPSGGSPAPPPPSQTTTSTSPGATPSNGSEEITDVVLSALSTVLGLLSA